MALVSPGVQVTVIDESFYTPAAPGTTPLIVVATAQDKVNGAGTATASATTKANAGKAFTLTSQRDLTDLFGVPFFEKTPSNTPIHGSERNEYGLLAAYSFLGVSSSAFIVRADIDLDQLEGTATAPGAEPDDGTWWVDTNDTAYGIQEWNGAAASTTGGQKFTTKTPIVLTSDDVSKITNNAPRASVGGIGDYCVVFESSYDSLSNLNIKENAKLYYKSAGNTVVGISAGQWVEVGSNDWVASHPTLVGAVTHAQGNTATYSGKTFYVNGTKITIGSTVDALVNSINGAAIVGVSARNVNNIVYLYSNGSTETRSDSAKSGNIVISLTGSDPTENPITAANLKENVIGFDIGAGTERTYFAPYLQISPHTDVPAFKRGASILDDETNPDGTSSTAAFGRPTGSVWVKTTEPNGGARWRVNRWSSASQAWVAVEAPLYLSGQESLYYLDRSGGGLGIPANSLYVQANATEHFSYTSDVLSPDVVVDATLKTAQFRVLKRATTGRTEITSSVITSTGLTAAFYEFEIRQSIKGDANLSDPTTISFTTAGNATDADTIAGAINAASYTLNGSGVATYVGAEVTADNQVVIYHTTGGEIRFTDRAPAVGAIESLFSVYNSYAITGTNNFYSLPAGAHEEYVASNWKPLAARVSSIDQGFYAQNGQPLNEPVDGQLWYNNDFADVDIMVHDGSTWVGYVNEFPTSNPTGPFVQASEPSEQDDGTALVQGDLWVSTADMENFPTIYKYDSTNLEWVLIDKTDQITDEGVLFADARYGSAGATGNTAASIVDLLSSDYLDPDAPDPALYPKGMLLWNLRRSGGNVKKYNNNYINTALDNVRYNDESMAAYATDRWSTESGNNEDGSGSFGRKAQRKVVVQRIKSVIDTSQEIRDEERRNFNLIAAPGYPETLSNLINLNIDRGQTAFVIGDTPLRLKSDATSLLNWGTNAALVTDNGDDGIVSYDEYCAVYYPNGFTTDLGGANAVVPASHMMLKTIALSDQVSYPWFAPAGTRRGGITNATAVGYIDATSGEFQTVALNEGTRDVLYDLKVNPIPFFVGVGLVAYGQKTRARNASALDRINVARLVVYLRSQLNKLARPYVFEPNDSITRDEIKGAVESLLLELVGLRALYDFAVVCDESNNTPSRIDRNELYVDIAIEPVKAVEFIYIPLRVKNTGEI